MRIKLSMRIENEVLWMCKNVFIHPRSLSAGLHFLESSAKNECAVNYLNLRRKVFSEAH